MSYSKCTMKKFEILQKSLTSFWAALSSESLLLKERWISQQGASGAMDKRKMD
jgi:hypothetical protein